MKVLVAMSGGVDSAVSAYLIKREYEALGVTMKLHDESDNLIYGENSCCSNQDIADAKAVCDLIGIDHEVHDFGASFKECVIGDFINSYKNGCTPNPCVICNRKIKFEELLKIALERGYDAIATGHYARIEKHSDGRYLLKKAIDLAKDQSYVLYSLTQHQLSHIIFPLGEMTKQDARELAEQIGFTNARKHDSQDICFVPDGDYVSFIERTTGETFDKGNFIDLQGNILGKHEGIIKYTIGQRKGLNIGGKNGFDCARWFVVEKDIKNNVLYVSCGENENMFSSSCIVKDFNWIVQPKQEMECFVKLRYRQPDQKTKVEMIDEKTLKLNFMEKQKSVTVGQFAVLYDENENCLGGGIIEIVK